jgi:hypothetical protein
VERAQQTPQQQRVQAPNNVHNSHNNSSAHSKSAAAGSTFYPLAGTAAAGRSRQQARPGSNSGWLKQAAAGRGTIISSKTALETGTPTIVRGRSA